MKKYLVVSYDDDQQQWFWDYIAAKTAEDAVAIVCERRPYVIAADAASLSQVQTITKALKSRPIARIIHQFDRDTATPEEERGIGRTLTAGKTAKEKVMANQNEGFAEIQRQRREGLEAIIGSTKNRTAALENGLEVPEIIPRFLGTEEDSGDVLWAYFGASLADVAKSFEESDTDGIFQYRAYDLDANTKYVPVFKVARWVEIEN